MDNDEAGFNDAGGDDEPGHASSPAGFSSDARDPRVVWDERYAAADLIWSATPNRLFAQEVESMPKGKAIDLGAGEGRNAIWLADQGWTVTAVDFSKVGIEKGRRIAAAKDLEIDWVVADLLDYELEPSAYDLVYLLFIHLSWAQMEGVLRRAALGLRPGGSLLVIGHDSTNLEEGVGGPQDPDRLYCAADIVKLFPNLEAPRAEAIMRPVSDGRQAVDAVIRLRRAP